MSRFPNYDALPEDLRAKQRACVRRHNRQLFSWLVPLFACLFVLIYALLHVPVEYGWIVRASLLPWGVLALYAIFAVLRADRAFCRQIGFVCPACTKPLYQASSAFGGDFSPLVVRGECPHCRHSFLATSTPA